MQSLFSKLLQKGYKKPSRRSASSCAEKEEVVLSNIHEQNGHEKYVETTVNVTDTVKELIHNVLGADDIQIISANRVPSSRKNGGSNTS